uniref:Uncharacterized protein n=1 Tax=Kalanchoe fedtschenkoi TaxID=63787 RepID=A0A7N0TEA8_KALFE
MSAAMVGGWVSQFSKLRERVKPRRPAGAENESEAARKKNNDKPSSPAAGSAVNPVWDSTLSEDAVFMLMDRFAPN